MINKMGDSAQRDSRQLGQGPDILQLAGGIRGGDCGQGLQSHRASWGLQHGLQGTKNENGGREAGGATGGRSQL